MRPTRYQLRQSPVRALAALLGSDATGRSRSKNAGTRDRTKDLQIFSLTLSQLSYHGDKRPRPRDSWVHSNNMPAFEKKVENLGIDPSASRMLSERSTI